MEILEEVADYEQTEEEVAELVVEEPQTLLVVLVDQDNHFQHLHIHCVSQRHTVQDLQLQVILFLDTHLHHHLTTMEEVVVDRNRKVALRGLVVLAVVAHHLLRLRSTNHIHQQIVVKMVLHILAGVLEVGKHKLELVETLVDKVVKVLL